MTNPRIGEHLFQFELREVRRLLSGQYEIPPIHDPESAMTMLTRSCCFAPPNIGSSFLPKVLPSIDDARVWVVSFVHWYNVEHRHSGIRYVSPPQRHAGEDLAILAARHALYASARKLNPARWSGKTRRAPQHHLPLTILEYRAKK